MILRFSKLSNVKTRDSSHHLLTPTRNPPHQESRFAVPPPFTIANLEPGKSWRAATTSFTTIGNDIGFKLTQTRPAQLCNRNGQVISTQIRNCNCSGFDFMSSLGLPPSDVHVILIQCGHGEHCNCDPYLNPQNNLWTVTILLAMVTEVQQSHPPTLT